MKIKNKELARKKTGMYLRVSLTTKQNSNIMTNSNNWEDATYDLNTLEIIEISQDGKKGGVVVLKEKLQWLDVKKVIDAVSTDGSKYIITITPTKHKLYK